MAKKTFDAEEAQARFPELLELAHRGKTTLVTRRGKPYALVVPLDHLDGGGLLGLRGSGKKLWGADSARSERRMRDEWA